MTREYLQDSHQAATGYETYLEERYQGEVYGEALFRTMAEHCGDVVRARKFRVLQQLERETKEFLVPALKQAGLSATESPERVEEGVKLGAQLAKAPWSDLMGGFRTELERFVGEFERAESLAPAGAEELLRHVTRHEQALLEFATRELEGGDAETSLDAVLALLRDAPAS
jgi:hypothetical protein